MACDRCGADVPWGMRFCIRCGAAVVEGAREEATRPEDQIPAASRKSGGIGVVLAAVVSVLVVILGWVLVWGFCQGWFAPEAPDTMQDQTQQTSQSQETEPTQPETTEPTQPEETEPALDPSLEAFQWEGMTVYLPRGMYEYCWNVDFMQYSGTDLWVRVTSLEITKNLPAKDLAEGTVRQWKNDFLRVELHEQDGVYYADGLFFDGEGTQIAGFYAAIDRAYIVSVWAEDDAQLEEMIQIATTAKLDANVVPRVHTEGYVAYSSTTQIGLDGLVMTVPEKVKLFGHCFDGTVIYQNDTYSLELYRGDMEQDYGERLTAKQIMDEQAALWMIQGQAEERDGVPYLVYEDTDGYLYVMSCFVRDGDYWLVSAESDTQRTTVEDLVQLVTGAELTTGT